MAIKTKQQEEDKIQTPGGKYIYANGKRKTSVAKVRLYKGKGSITVNNRPVSQYFPVKELVNSIQSPLKSTGNGEAYDVIVKVVGGGQTGQAEAVRHGISKALVEADEANKVVLRKLGYLTRDSRVKERKKFGLKKARKAPQFSKR